MARTPDSHGHRYYDPRATPRRRDVDLGLAEIRRQCIQLDLVLSTQLSRNFHGLASVQGARGSGPAAGLQPHDEVGVLHSTY